MKTIKLLGTMLLFISCGGGEYVVQQKLNNNKKATIFFANHRYSRMETSGATESNNKILMLKGVPITLSPFYNWTLDALGAAPVLQTKLGQAWPGIKFNIVEGTNALSAPALAKKDVSAYILDLHKTAASDLYIGINDEVFSRIPMAPSSCSFDFSGYFNVYEVSNGTVQNLGSFSLANASIEDTSCDINQRLESLRSKRADIKTAYLKSVENTLDTKVIPKIKNAKE